MRCTAPSIAFVAAALAVPLCAFAQYMIWMYAPVEAQMGIVQKIFYTHLPAAWVALAAFAVVFGASIHHLLTRRASSDRLAGAACEVGVVFAALALGTGMLWARPMWGVWWTWDPKLTTTLVMLFIYCGYLLLGAAGPSGPRGALIRAVVGVAAFLDVPLVFWSARLWRTIHPQVLGREGGGLPAEMWHAVLAGFAGFAALAVAFVALRYAQRAMAERIERALVERTRM